MTGDEYEREIARIVDGGFIQPAFVSIDQNDMFRHTAPEMPQAVSEETVKRIAVALERLAVALEGERRGSTVPALEGYALDEGLCMKCGDRHTVKAGCSTQSFPFSGVSG